MAKLTDRECKLSKTEKKDLFLGDGGGLYLRIRPGKNCIKSWLFRYKRLDGSGTKWMDIGFYPDTSLLEARSIAIELKRKLRNNIDPTSEAEAQLQAEEDQKRLLESRITLIKLFERWEKLELANRKDKGKETRRRFEKDIFPVLGSKPIEEITRVDIANALDAIVERGAKIIARSLLGELRQMFGFGIGRGILDNDPTSHMKRDSFGKKVERDRVLSEAELKLLPNLLSNASMLDTSISAIWIMLGTCCRVGEIIRARWEDIDFEKREWTIPPEHAKNAKKTCRSPFSLLCSALQVH